MIHSPLSDLFLVSPCITDFVYKINSLCAVDADSLVITTNEGYLLYVLISTGESHKYKIIHSRRISLNRSSSGFSSNHSLSPVQFVRLGNTRLVFLLVDSVLVAYEVPSLDLFPRQSSQLQFLSEKSSGAHVFSVHSWNEEKAYIAIAAKKRVRLLTLDSSHLDSGFCFADDGSLQVRSVVSMKSDLDNANSRRTAEPSNPSELTSSFYILRRMKGLMSSNSVREPIALPLPDSDRWLLELEQASVFRIFSPSEGFMNHVTFLSSENQVPLSFVHCLAMESVVLFKVFICKILCPPVVFLTPSVLKLSLREPIWDITKQLENEDQLQLALEIAESLPEDFGRERVYSLREALSLDALKKGNHSLAIAFLTEMNISTQQILELRDKYVPQSWKEALEEASRIV
ncbi:hypothetical protein Gasu2_43180 [Galdieria sulphuraria]|nr:hypothetical protein Gasu2_43180 [Galdieria sulphuraria]